MNIIIASIVAGIIFTAAVFGLKAFLSARKAGSGSSSQIQEVEERCAALAEKISKAVSVLDRMVPLDDYVERDSQIKTLNKQLGEERAKLEKLDKAVEKMQRGVEAEEAAHNALKKGKEDAVILAGEIRANKERLTSEVEQLEAKLETSLAELTALSGEVGLSREQQAAVDKISNALENSRTQMRASNDVYTQASTRFTNLEAQYVELEKEFTKLVEKELSGNM